MPIPTERMQYKNKFFSNNNKFNILNFEAEYTIKEITLNSLNYLYKNNNIKSLKDIKIENNIFNYNAANVPINILCNIIQIIEFNEKHLMIKIHNINKTIFINIIKQ